MNGKSQVCCKVTAFTHRGARRDRNEDTVAAGRWICNETMLRPQVLVLPLDTPVACLVADGMGGHAAGCVASFHAAIRWADAAARFHDEPGVEQFLQQLSDELVAYMTGHPELLGMGATVAGLLLSHSNLICFNVGDSKVYREQSGFLRLVSVDDVPASSGAVVAEGQNPPPRSNHRITQALGGGLERLLIAPHTTREALHDGDRYLICSDGLTDMLSLDEIEACFSSDDEEVVATLFERAMIKGGEDNISILVVRTQPEAPASE